MKSRKAKLLALLPNQLRPLAQRVAIFNGKRPKQNEFRQKDVLPSGSFSAEPQNP